MRLRSGRYYETGESSTAAIVPIQQTGDIFKLDIDCFEEAFDFLLIEDLASVGITCKRLQQVGGYCFQQNYGGLNKWLYEDIATINEERRLNLNCFIPFIDQILFGNADSFQMFHKNQSKFMRLKQMKFKFMRITSFEINCIKGKLHQLEVLRLKTCTFDGDFYEKLLKFCLNLKKLSIEWRFDAGPKNDWLLKNYPNLEYFEFESRHNRAINELLPFFEKNSTVRMFSTNEIFLCDNRATMMSGKVKLDDLAVLVEFIARENYELSAFLNELFDRGVFKRLHLNISNSIMVQQVIDGIAKSKALTKLHIDFDRPIIFPVLHDLQEICINNVKHIINFEDMTSKLPNLRQIYIEDCSSTDLLMFIRRTVNLRKICVDFISSGLYFEDNDNFIDLVGLNKERQRLNGAEKITFYVGEHLYVSTKRAMKDTVFSHITMKRAESHDWKHSFFHDY